MKYGIIVQAFVVAVIAPALGSAALSPGDVFVVGYNCDVAARDFAFIVLTDVADAETIFFTDKGWTSNSVLYAGEGIIEYMPPAGGLVAGTVVHVTNTATLVSVGADQGVAAKSGSFTLAGGGDQILVYQGTEAGPTFISALSWDSTDWANGDASDKSLVPAGLTEGVTALHTDADLDCGAANLANGAWTSSLSGLKQDIMFDLRQAASWSFDESNALALSSQDHSVTVPLAFQGFEDAADDTWSMVSGSTISSDMGQTDTPPGQRVRSGGCSHQTSNSVTTLLLAEVPTTGEYHMKVTLHISSTATSFNGADSDDMVEVFVALNGAAFPGMADLTVVGYNNARWSYSGVSLSTTAGVPVAGTLTGGGSRDDDADGYSTLSIAIPSQTTHVQLKVKTTNNSSSEIWNIDDISLVTTPPALGTIVFFN